VRLVVERRQILNIDGDMASLMRVNHLLEGVPFFYKRAWAASPGGTSVRPSRLKPAAQGAPIPQADKHPTAMTPTANRRRNWAIS
jgi:hypothetical protein